MRSCFWTAVHVVISGERRHPTPVKEKRPWDHSGVHQIAAAPQPREYLLPTFSGKFSLLPKKRLCSLTATISCGRQVSARKLKPHPPRPQSLHERLLEDIKAERKLRPVSPDLIRRSRLGMCRGVNAILAILPETQSYLLRLHFMVPSTSEFKNH